MHLCKDGSIYPSISNVLFLTICHATRKRRSWQLGANDLGVCGAKCYSEKTRPWPELSRSSGVRLATMKFLRLVSVVDIAVVGVAAFAIGLPPRTMEAAPASRLRGDETVSAALQEARAIAHPEDGKAVAAASQFMSDGGYRDWAVEMPRALSERDKASPVRWQALRAVSAAYLDRFELGFALDYANRAIAACESAGPEACPAWDSIRMELFAKHLDAGIKSGINPHRDPAGFSKAAGDSVRHIRLTPKAGMGGPTPAPAAPVTPTTPALPPGSVTTPAAPGPTPSGAAVTPTP